MKTEFKDRLSAIINSLNMNPNQFAELIGTSPRNIYNILNGPNDPSWKIVQAIFERCPNVSADFISGRSSEIFTGGAEMNLQFGDNSKIRKKVVVNHNSDDSEKLDQKVAILSEKLKSKDKELELKDQLLAEKQEMVNMLKDRLKQG